MRKPRSPARTPSVKLVFASSFSSYTVRQTYSFLPPMQAKILPQGNLQRRRRIGEWVGDKISEARGVPRASADESNLQSSPSLRKDLNRWPRVAVLRGELKLHCPRIVR